MTDVPLKSEGLVRMNRPDAADQRADAIEPRAVLVVEDHPLVAEATGMLLAGCGGPFKPVISSTAAQAIEKLDDQSCQWFCILLDLDVPGAYGLSLAREVEKRGMAGRCCVVSAFDTPEYVAEIWSRGFLGYITKAIPVGAFTAALMTVLSGERSFPFSSSSSKVAGVRLTRRQTQLLECIRAGRSSKEIATELHIAEGTVNNHVAAILQGLDASSRAQAVAKAIELGFLESRPQHIAPAKGPIVRSRRW